MKRSCDDDSSLAHRRPVGGREKETESGGTAARTVYIFFPFFLRPRVIQVDTHPTDFSGPRRFSIRSYPTDLTLVVPAVKISPGGGGR
jgi:hypothetical protein